MTPAQFNKIIRSYYEKHGRHDLPWRKTRDPYRILVSEIMLQQTQVARVKPFYKNFIQRFPNFEKLANVRTSDVLRAWQGLGYNRRAIALQRLSRIVLKEFNGVLPRTREELESLPGIGRGTSGAVLAFAFNEPAIFIETNIRRVFIHFFFPRRKKVTDEEIERCIIRTIDKKNPRTWYWALMDYGAAMPKMARGAQSAKNPNIRSAHYEKQSTFAGSRRELRGKILRSLLTHKKIGIAPLAKQLKEPAARVRNIATALVREGFIGRNGNYYCINN